MLSIKHLNYCVNKKKLLADVSLEINAGEILSLVGPNGAGKSTLLKAIVGDVQPQSGTIIFAGNKIADWNLQERAKQMAVLPQAGTLNFPFTVQEVVRLGRVPHSTGRETDLSIVEKAMSLMGISDLSRRLYTHLSGGEKQRTQLARVMSQIWCDDKNTSNTQVKKILILDEPTSSLDIRHQQILLKAVRDFSKMGVSIVMALHDINLASEYCDYIVGLNNGEVVISGTPDDVITQQSMQALFSTPLYVTTHPETGRKIIIP